ncbi:MAG: site-specific integrase [Myxococcales bacterium]|nr:site-specific integrase [Myxococcales bacterium]MCB9626553.1 site-specific integrase [Sandaracinaceae bacterium]
MIKTKYPGVQRIAPGRYQLRLKKKDPRTGKMRDTYRRVDAQSDVHASETRAQLLREVMSPSAPARVRVADAATSWLRSKLSTLRPSTRDTYALALDHLVNGLGDFYVDAVTLQDLATWRDSMVGKPVTINGRLRVAKTFFADMSADTGQASPAARLRTLPVPERTDDESNVLSREELTRVLHALRADSPQWYPLILTLVLTGMRFGEATALEWDDIKDDRIHVVRAQVRGKVGPTKTKTRRTVPLLPELAAILREHRLDLVRRQAPGLDEGRVFPSAVGTYLRTPGVRKAFIKALAAAGVRRRVTLHGMRRTLNNELRKSADGMVVRAITGHVTEAMTEHYSHVAFEERLAAVASLRVGTLVGTPSTEAKRPAGAATPTGRDN